MNTDTGEIQQLTLAHRLALCGPEIMPASDRFPKLTNMPGMIPRLEAKARGDCNYDAAAVAAAMVEKAMPSPGKMVELRGNPDPDCEECHGKGAAGGGKGTDGKFHPCRCCAMPIFWCNIHQRQATHIEEGLGSRRGLPCCDPKLGGVAMPCINVVELTGIAELFTE